MKSEWFEEIIFVSKRITVSKLKIKYKFVAVNCEYV